MKKVRSFVKYENMRLQTRRLPSASHNVIEELTAFFNFAFRKEETKEGHFHFSAEVYLRARHTPLA